MDKNTKGITYKSRTVRPACYSQPDCQCMHCQQNEAKKAITPQGGGGLGIPMLSQIFIGFEGSGQKES